VMLSLGAVHFVIFLVNQPDSEEVSSLLFDELADKTLVVLACPCVIGGDFNVKVQLTGDSGARRMRDLLTCFDMVQHVKGPTHNQENTFVLVITTSTCPLNDVDIEPAS